MTSKRIGFLAGGALAGTLLLGTAGLALAQDPTPAPSGSPWGSGMMGGQNGAGMMGGQNGAGMMGGQNGAGMMGGQNGAGMMGGQNGAGMMGDWSQMAGRMGNLTADQLAQMKALHDQMVASGTCDPAQMQQLHQQLQPNK